MILGVSVQDSPGDKLAAYFVELFLGERYQKPGQAIVALQDRLRDAPAAGLGEPV